MSLTLTRLSRSSWFKIEYKEIIIHIDPGYAGVFENQNIPLKELEDRADYICITHCHKDHLRIDMIEKMVDANTTIIGPKCCKEEIKQPMIVVRAKDALEFDEVKSKVVDAYNTPQGKSINKYHKKGEFVGFVIEVGGKRLYFAGDTDLIDEMYQLGVIDVACIPIGGTYVMYPDEALLAVRAIKPQMVIPMHEANEDVYGFIDEVKKYGIETIVLKIGEKANIAY